MTTNEKISALRAAVQAAGAQGVLLMTSDPHSGEYLPAHYRSLTYFSGFTGDNATLVVTLSGSALWVDGRFYIQADKQLAGTEIESMHMGYAGVPTVEAYLAAHFAAGQTLLLDGATVPAALVQKYQQALAPASATVVSRDIISPLWQGRPALPCTPCTLLSAAQAGLTPAEKLAQIRAALQKQGATALAVTQLGAVAWLLNLRARDLPCTPVALAYAFVSQDSCTLFLAPGRLSEADAATLAENGVALRPYDALRAFVRSYA
ncbi:MAG: aminopeptidase P family N-terminal domain-containing protein, partial [Gemmiger sp.]|nr:aminopeptidase P family N-terminal domain-containing protein [Gemmiger sp.]